MAVPKTGSEFAALVGKSGLIDAGRLADWLRGDRAVAALPLPAPKLARLMIRDELLTRFQAEQLLRGKHRGFTLGNYRLLERLGRGGVAQVFLCEHQSMRHRVAVKVLPPDLSRDPIAVERFHREARAAAALVHPNIVRAFDINREGGLYFLVMEYVDGTDLQALVNQVGPLPVGQAVDYARQAAEALAAVHAAGMVHRDVKPANLLLDRTGTVKLLDLGLALICREDTESLTRKEGQGVMGTVDFLSPEQAIDSHTVDIRADIYGLGGTTYFLLSGRVPFEGESLTLKLVAHQGRMPTPLRELRPAIPVEVAAVVAQMMAKDPAQRYQTPAEVARALAPWATVSNAVPASLTLRPPLPPTDSESVVSLSELTAPAPPDPTPTGNESVVTWSEATPGGATIRPLTEVPTARMHRPTGGRSDWTARLLWSAAGATGVLAVVALTLALGLWPSSQPVLPTPTPRTTPTQPATH